MNESRKITDKDESMVIIGRYDVPVGSNGIIELPEDWRASLVGDASCVYVHIDRKKKCIDIVPTGTMEVELSKMRERSLTDPAMFAALQTIGKHISQVKVEDGCRIELPESLRECCGIKKSAVLVGAIRCAKAYAPETIAAANDVSDKLEAAMNAAGFND